MADIREHILAEFENIDRVLEQLPSSKDLPSLSTLELAGVAALVHSFYNGIENVLKQVLKSRGLSIPTGETWHKNVIEAACRESIISEASRDSIKEYLAFRHFFSHAYAFDLDPARLEPLVMKLRIVYATFKADLASIL